jgi:hypothetical protein
MHNGQNLSLPHTINTPLLLKCNLFSRATIHTKFTGQSYLYKMSLITMMIFIKDAHMTTPYDMYDEYA